MLSTVSFGYERINVIPKEITPNTNAVYVVYELNYSVPVSNFSLNLVSDGIQFDNTSINIQYIEKNKGISGKIRGKITNRSMEKYDILIFNRFSLNGSLISSIMHYHIYKSNELSNESPTKKSNNISINANTSTNTNTNTKQLNVSNKTINSSEESYTNTANNPKDDVKKEFTNNTDGTINKNSNENNKKYDDNKNNNNENNKIYNDNENKDKSDDYLLYGILGVIMGVIIAAVVVHLFNI
jgi:hypothetical protein